MNIQQFIHPNVFQELGSKYSRCKFTKDKYMESNNFHLLKKLNFIQCQRIIHLESKNSFTLSDCRKHPVYVMFTMEINEFLRVHIQKKKLSDDRGFRPDLSLQCARARAKCSNSVSFSVSSNRLAATARKKQIIS